jgi:hypothetical protein
VNPGDAFQRAEQSEVRYGVRELVAKVMTLEIREEIELVVVVGAMYINAERNDAQGAIATPDRPVDNVGRGDRFGRTRHETGTTEDRFALTF